MLLLLLMPIDKTLVNSRTAGFHSHQAHFLKTQQPLGKEIKILLSLSPCWLGRFFGLNIDFTFFCYLSKRAQSLGAFWRIMQSSLKSSLYKWACGISVNSFTWLKGHYGKMTSRTESHLRKKCISFFCHSNYSVFFNICTHTHSICSFTDISIISCHLKCWFTP